MGAFNISGGGGGGLRSGGEDESEGVSMTDAGRMEP